MSVRVGGDHKTDDAIYQDFGNCGCFLVPLPGSASETQKRKNLRKWFTIVKTPQCYSSVSPNPDNPRICDSHSCRAVPTLDRRQNILCGEWIGSTIVWMLQHSSTLMGLQPMTQPGGPPAIIVSFKWTWRKMKNCGMPWWEFLFPQTLFCQLVCYLDQLLF